ncbi:MAG: hypothetical protein IJS13_02105 [Paludibacteraceae bacterium]|nr:hypothetical protein [Paludibacteraceae bacterium]
MHPTTTQKLTKADIITKQILNVSAIVLLSILLLWIIWSLVENYLFSFPAQANAIIHSVFKTSGIVVFCLFLLTIVVSLILSPFVKSDDEQEFEEKVNYILSKTNLRKNTNNTQDIVSPLINLTKQQEECICQLLRDLPPNNNDSNKINTALVSQHLTALRDLGYLSDKNIYALYSWVGFVTNKELPNFNHFNEAYPSTTTRKVDKAKADIESELEKLR